jgi:nitrogen regulatory protein PII
MDEEELRLLTVVVERKRGEAVIDAALEAGAAGATYFYAQGTGVRQRLGGLGALIGAEKQVLLVVAGSARADAVLEAVAKAGRLSEPGMGFAFVQKVSRAVGLLPGGGPR